MFPRALAFETRMRSFEPRAPVITKKHPARIGIFHWTQSNKFFIAKFSFFLPNGQFSCYCCGIFGNFSILVPSGPLLLASTKPGWSNTGSPRLTSRPIQAEDAKRVWQPSGQRFRLFGAYQMHRGLWGRELTVTSAEEMLTRIQYSLIESFTFGSR